MTSRNRFDPADDREWPVPKDCELLDGRFVEMPSGAYRGWVSGQLMFALGRHCDAHDLGWVFPSTLGYRFFPPGVSRLRKVSCSFIRKGRFPNDRIPQGDCRIPPDLAAYLVGPEDSADFVIAKQMDFLRHGTRLMWIVKVKGRSALAFREDGTGRALAEDDFLDGEDVLPGFRCRLGDLFRHELEPDAPIHVPAAE